MEAALWHAPHQLEIVKTDIPKLDSPDQVLVKVTYCGVCGTDHHLAEGDFLGKFPLIPGHEIVGVVAEIGADVTNVAVGDRVVIDPTILECGHCFFCLRGERIMCQNFDGLGVTLPGGLAEYVVSRARKVFKIKNLSDVEATLVEPAACAVHGVDKLQVPVGAEALVIGAGPTGLILAQLLKLNGATKVVVAANKSIKTQVARDIGAGDVVIELDREHPDQQWRQLKEDHPFGFDVVVEATGSEKVATDAINYVRRGGTLMIYGVYANSALVHWAPSKIFGDEIRIIGSFVQTACFPRAIAYLDSGKIKVKGIVTDVFPIKDFQKALDKMNSKGAVKVVVKATRD
ncbi:D-arabinitol dehydrogenase 1 [Leucoagaricus sp. SymC.cos]|nr:D-arabinitol dehydrogenase 1 [Leucoagaricus sp. SymC.cos]